MSQIVEWENGINGYLKCQMISTSAENSFTVELRENEFEPDRDINDIFYDHLKNRQTTYVEVLFSGGLDSELVLKSCLTNKIPVVAVTMIIKMDGVIINAHDLYYAEKFCRENNVKHRLVEFDALSFFSSGKHLEYLSPYKVVEPHVASHLWLFEQCDNYPIFGGDWPWVQAHKKPDIVLSPIRSDYLNYDRFIQSRGISGIGNMLGHSFESAYYFMKQQLKYSNYSIYGYETTLKSKMYQGLEPRIRSYGWENCPPNLFNKLTYKKECISIMGRPAYKIIWGPKVCELLDTSVRENTKFM
jgi:hypothetical protein